MNTFRIPIFSVMLCLCCFLSVTLYAQDSSHSTTKETIVTTQNNNHRIDYIEFSATDIAATKSFYTAVFGWKFTDYGPEYVSFEDGRISGGFVKVPAMPAGNGAIVVIYSSALTETQEAVVRNGGKITKPPFDFPGGRRFHFTDPNGNELAVWSEK
jgi:predicted enzyme related to lactoylglutathione lyase